MSTTVTIEQIDKIEFDLVAALAGFPAVAAPMRAKATALLAKVRSVKRQLLAAAPDVLRKSSARAPAAPSWRGLPVDNIAAATLAKEARSRAARKAGSFWTTASHHRRAAVWPSSR